MKKFATLTVFVLLTMLLLAGTASANLSGAVYGWANSNRSGEIGVYGGGGIPGNPLLRNVPSQLTHTAFQLNTNSCASCHMTHTAVGTNLLIQASTQATCMACHDGTIGFLNVRAAATGTTSGAGMGGSVAAGTFGVVESVYASDRTASMHNVFSAVTISGAPGGNRAGVVEQAGATWTNTFTCASCHAPHGSHSIRLLHGNPNNVAVRAIAPTSAGVNGGRWSPNARATATGGFTVASATYSATYQRWIYPATSVVTAAYPAPWVAGYSTSITHAVYGRLSAHWTRIYHSAWDPNLINADPSVSTNWTATNIQNLLNRYFTVNFATGELSQTDTQRNDLISFLQNAPFNLDAAAAASAPLNIDVARGLRVRATANTAYSGDLVAGAREVDFINPATYDARAYSLFCAACHTDYLPTIGAGSQTGSGVGIYSQKFRHTINRGASTAVNPMPVRGGTTFTAANLTGSPGGTLNSMTCLSCHFAHGANASMMLLADNSRVSAGTGLAGTPTDPNQNDVSATLGGSSALKRYINQASCWHCHVRSSATVFHNSEVFWTQFPNGPTW